ncbi:HvfC family RiPP maturation protein [Neptuniibacter halophilus]|uniref:HvfC family RiPP maturation protein n=1 Tax=Neptuniibacter halophilus TaxID=651666 RepID=UPI00257484FE|nr:putative DNA-binding domain-containing protein [Neptuniibacter halophilus]
MPRPSPDRSEFQQLQYAFAGHIRNPDAQSAPEGVEDRRMGIYRELFFNNVEGFLAGNFPVLKKISSQDYWLKLVRSFLDQHRCQTPYFLEIGEEFIDFVSHARQPEPEDPPFLAELLHYEWVELALDASEIELPVQDVDANGDLLQGHPRQSPLAWLLSYQFPVHGIGPEFQPQAPGQAPTFLIAYRNREDQVHFMEVNQVTARLLYLLNEDDALSGREALLQIAEEMQHPDPEMVLRGGAETLEHLRTKGIILGTLR